jgi:hypothetical protein
MKFPLLSVFALCLSANFAFAGTSSGGGTGPVGSYVTCAGQLANGINASFEVRATAAPTIVDSVILNSDSNELIAHLFCEKGGAVAPGAPSAGEIQWVCGRTEWDQSTDGGTSVTVMLGGVTGVTTAQIEEKQMFPLPPLQLGTLLCK